MANYMASMSITPGVSGGAEATCGPRRCSFSPLPMVPLP